MGRKLQAQCLPCSDFVEWLTLFCSICRCKSSERLMSFSASFLNSRDCLMRASVCLRFVSVPCPAIITAQSSEAALLGS